MDKNPLTSWCWVSFFPMIYRVWYIQTVVSHRFQPSTHSCRLNLSMLGTDMYRLRPWNKQQKPLKINGWKMKFPLGWPIFRGHVSSREGMLECTNLKYTNPKFVNLKLAKPVGFKFSSNVVKMDLVTHILFSNSAFSSSWRAAFHPVRSATLLELPMQHPAIIRVVRIPAFGTHTHAGISYIPNFPTFSTLSGRDFPHKQKILLFWGRLFFRSWKS